LREPDSVDRVDRARPAVRIGVHMNVRHAAQSLRLHDSGGSQ